MSEEKIIEKDDWNTILGELDEIVRELDRFTQMAMGNKETFDEESTFPALIHFISELKNEKKSKSWEKIESFANSSKENLKLLEETLQIKQQNKLIDRTFIGVLPKNTNEIGKRTVEIINELPGILRIINESVEAMLIDIKLKLGFPIVKFEKEILEIKHQIDLLDEEIKSHSKTKKGFVSKDEQMVYTQAFREIYLAILEKAQNYLVRDFNVHSKAFEDVYTRYQSRIAKYRENPAFDDFIKENCFEIEKTIDGWLTKGFKVFIDAQKFTRKIDDRLSDTRQTFIQQIKTELENEVNQLIKKLENIKQLESIVQPQAYSKITDSSEKITSSMKFFLKTVDVVSEDPHDKLINDEKILLEAINMTSAAYQATYGNIEEKLDAYTKKIDLSSNTKKIISSIDDIKGSCTGPNNLIEAIETISLITDYNKTMDVLLKEMAVDIQNTQKKYLKKIKNINKYFGKADAVSIPDETEIVSVSKVNLDDLETLKKIELILKKPLAEAAEILNDFEDSLSDGLGISINPKLESKVERYMRPSFKPTIKQVNKAMSELEGFAEDLAVDTGNAINTYIKELKNFPVKTKALDTFVNLLKNIGKEAIGGKATLYQITAKLEQAITEYSKLLANELDKHAQDLNLIIADPSALKISNGMNLENFSIKHDELVTNISLESVMEQQKKQRPELKCKICGAPIVSQKEDYDDMLGFEILRVKCQNNHEDTIIGLGGEDENKKEEEPIEIKCSKCGSETFTPISIDIFSKDSLIVSASCPKNHKSDITIKKK
ncbi:MAG: hypothetical protein ACFFDW_13435 [Candidatus Thorarchaeota archaeon]